MNPPEVISDNCPNGDEKGDWWVLDPDLGMYRITNLYGEPLPLNSAPPATYEQLKDNYPSLEHKTKADMALRAVKMLANAWDEMRRGI